MLSIGTLLGPYEILGPLGAGGMGEVYRARDTRLGREVAIKGLPAPFASHPERLARFEREARLLASLNHPGIAILYGLEQSGELPYLVLELIEGETLATRLTRGTLPVRETLELGVQVAAAVAAAHERDIVHRDLKPGNVMLSSSRGVKVLDFGLAKSNEGESLGSSPSLSMSPTMALGSTGMGVILGTAAYMSPEQARGQVVDRRTDVWAFGCLLFECLSGRQAFAGETVSDTIARILEREPDWNALPASVPSRLQDVLRRCLTKSAGDRPRDLGDIGRELSALALELSSGTMKASSSMGRPSLAVLYFENLAKDSESEYFCSGITEDILADLSKIKGLRVASRNAVQRYRGAAADIPKVGAELGVGAVLEGSVRRAGDRVRITVQLVNASDGFQLWAERYDRTMEDVFAVQEEIASSIAEALRVALTPAEAAKIAEARPQNVRAYDLYLKGRELYGAYTDASLHEALELFRQATDVDSGYALAWAGIAECYGQLCQWGESGDIAELTRLGLAAARKAIALNPGLPEAHKAEALNLRFSGDRDGSRTALQRALDSDPRFTPALMNLTVTHVVDADLAAAERCARRAIEVDPQEAFAISWLSMLTLITRRDDESLVFADRIRRLTASPFYVTATHVLRAWIYLRRGDLASVERARREGASDGARAGDLRAVDAVLAACKGNLEQSRQQIRELGDMKGLMAGSRLLAAEAALRAGDAEIAAGILDTPLMDGLAAIFARLQPSLHGVLDSGPFPPRRSNLALVWPLEAPMLDASVHTLFREVRVESGLPPASEVRPAG